MNETRLYKILRLIFIMIILYIYIYQYLKNYQFHCLLFMENKSYLNNVIMSL